jgi:TolB-like protein/Tfp pilus assembly protein PilF
LNKNRFRQFYRELRHRKVIRFALAYAILAWLIIEISSVIFPAFLFPEWTVRLVIILLTLGFIPALVLAWIFDFTLQGIERTGSETLSPSEVTLGENTHAHPPQIEDAVASVAVLPFDNLGNVDDNRVFAEGIATEIHGKICQLHRLRVAPRRSSFRFSDRDEPLNEIAQSLNVRYILSGSVLAVGARIQITAELDDAQQNTQLWSRKYERDLNDVLTLMSEIAEAVVAKFGGERLRSEISSALAKPTDSLEAWSLVQRARAYIVDYNAGSFSSAEDALQQAIELDPDYSAARAALGSVLAEKVLNGFSSDAKADSDLAIEMIESAATQSPNDPFVLKMSGMVWSSLGDPNRAIRALRLSVGIAPYDFGAWGFLGWPLVATGKAEDLEELHSVLSRILAMAPEHPGAAYWLHHRGAAFLCDDDLDAARQFVEQSIDKHRGLSWAWLTYANILGSLGEHRKAREAADEATRLNANMTVPHYASRLEVMTADGTTLQRRTAGLRAAELLD